MRTTPGPCAIAAMGLIVGLSACGAPTGNSGSEISTPTQTRGAQTSTPSPSTAATTSASPGSAPSAPSTAGPVLIMIKDFTFTIPASVAHGAKVMVKNQDGETHTLTSVQRGAFDVTVDGGGGTATLETPTKPGSYMFGCKFHANMMGKLVVR